MKAFIDLPRNKGDLLVLTSTVCWGASYSLITIALSYLASFNLMALRFTLAFLLTGLIFNKTLRKMRLKDCGHGLGLALALFTGNALLTYALGMTSIANAGFLTGFTVVFVAAINAAMTRTLPGKPLLAGLLLSLLGVGALTLKGGFTMQRGDALCLLGAFMFAVHIFLAERAGRESDALGACILQFGFIALFSWLGTLLFEQPMLPPTGKALAAVCALAVFGSSIGFICQLLGQRFTTPTRTAFIFLMEPLFALLFAYLFAGEAVTLRTALGGALVIGGVYASGRGAKGAGG